MRVIDADAFKKILSEHEMKHDKRRSFDDYDCGAANAYEHASDLLDDMPTVERPHGEWIEQRDNYGEPYYECSACKDSFITLEGTPKENHYNFCPNCGASMQKEGEEK